MLSWQLLVIAGIIFLIIEMITPVLFFLNFALACFFTAVVGFFVNDLNILIPICFVFSGLFLMFLRPLLVKSRLDNPKTGIEEKYIGKTAKVIDSITSSKGVISIYNERWEARSNDGEEIPTGSEVKIIRNESLVLFVEKVNG